MIHNDEASEDSRYAVSERLDWSRSWCLTGIDDDLDLEGLERVWNGPDSEACLHGSLVNKQAVQLFGSLGSSAWFAESNSSDTTAGAILVVGDENPLDWSSRLCEVFLCAREVLISIPVRGKDKLQ